MTHSIWLKLPTKDVFLTLHTAVIPGRATWREPQMCNCTSGNLEVMTTRFRIPAAQAPE
jgi:hypothetical protein